MSIVQMQTASSVTNGIPSLQTPRLYRKLKQSTQTHIQALGAVEKGQWLPLLSFQQSSGSYPGRYGLVPFQHRQYLCGNGRSAILPFVSTSHPVIALVFAKYAGILFRGGYYMIVLITGASHTGKTLLAQR